MGFWFFMLFMVLLIPTIVTFFGMYFCKQSPTDINNVFGYRTKRSMKNMDTWKYAHHFIGKTWTVIGVVMFVLSLVLMLLVLNKDKNKISSMVTTIMLAELVPLLVSIVVTEVKLNKVFDKQGKRRN